jgi:hypothetical protein
MKKFSSFLKIFLKRSKPPLSLKIELLRLGLSQQQIDVTKPKKRRIFSLFMRRLGSVHLSKK